MSQNSLLTAADNLLLEIFLSRALHELDLSFFPLYHKYLEVSKKHSHMKWLCAILSRLLRCRPWDLRLHELTKFQEQTQQSLAMVLHFTLNKNRNPYDGLQGLHNLSPSMSPPTHTHVHTYKLWPSLPLQPSLLPSPGSSHITHSLQPNPTSGPLYSLFLYLELSSPKATMRLTAPLSLDLCSGVVFSLRTGLATLCHTSISLHPTTSDPVLWCFLY